MQAGGFSPRRVSLGSDLVFNTGPTGLKHGLIVIPRAARDSELGPLSRIKRMDGVAGETCHHPETSPGTAQHP
jgi:hypothetical protein